MSCSDFTCLTLRFLKVLDVCDCFVILTCVIVIFAIICYYWLVLMWAACGFSLFVIVLLLD